MGLSFFTGRFSFMRGALRRSEWDLVDGYFMS